MSARIDITGQRFNRWTVIRYAGGQLWECRCECGTLMMIGGRALRVGDRLGCRSCRSYPDPIHGLVGTKVHNAWAGMIQRCSNPSCRGFPYYGGRGITICEEWRSSFVAFRDWAFCNGFADNLTLDRRDNMAGYSPENCRWATRQTQARNRRSSRIIDWRGERMTVAELSDRSGVKSGTIRMRLSRGWSVDQATELAGVEIREEIKINNR